MKMAIFFVEQRNFRKINYFIAKRCFDIISSFIGLLVLFPVFIVIALIIKITTKGSVLFKHKRVGFKGKEIYIYKFRTMVEDAEEHKKNFTQDQILEFSESFKLKDDPRVTYIGRFLRRSSLDEIPQFLNVLLGHMSIVGPRPITEEELEKYGANIDMLLSIKPGITGMWQVYGRSNTSYCERISLDLQYVNNANFKIDIKIIFKTILKVLLMEGAY